MWIELYNLLLSEAMEESTLQNNVLANMNAKKMRDMEESHSKEITEQFHRGLISEVYSCPEASKLYGVHESKIKRLASEGKFLPTEARHTGRNWLITKIGMDQLFKKTEG